MISESSQPPAQSSPVLTSARTVRNPRLQPHNMFWSHLAYARSRSLLLTQFKFLDPEDLRREHACPLSFRCRGYTLQISGTKIYAHTTAQCPTPRRSGGVFLRQRRRESSLVLRVFLTHSSLCCIVFGGSLEVVHAQWILNPNLKLSELPTIVIGPGVFTVRTMI